MTEHFSIDYKRRARERAEERASLEEANRQDQIERGIGPNSFFSATSSTKTSEEGVEPKFINGENVQGKPEPARDLKPPKEPLKFEPYLQPDDKPLTGNKPTHHRPVATNRKVGHTTTTLRHGRSKRSSTSTR